MSPKSKSELSPSSPEQAAPDNARQQPEKASSMNRLIFIIILFFRLEIQAVVPAGVLRNGALG